MGAVVGGATVVASELLLKKIDTGTIPPAPQEAEPDPRYTAFLKLVENGDREVMQTAMEQVKAYSEELNVHVQSIVYLEDRVSKVGPKERGILEMSLEQYRGRVDFLKRWIQGFSDPIRQYYEKNPGGQPPPNSAINSAKSARREIM